jgi:predicted nucleotidyltransferase
MVKKNKSKKSVKKSKKTHVVLPQTIPSLQLRNEHEIALDFATKVYGKFEKAVKSIVLFGSSVKQTAVAGSDIDIIIIIDDVSIKWDQEMIAWYREELDKIIRANPYQKALHLNTIKLSTWWNDLLNGDPVVINVLRYGEALIDLGGFFEPLKFLLIEGKIKPTPEAVYNALQRAPLHLQRSKAAELGAVEGLYWAMVDASQAALIAANVSPPSPEHIPVDLKQTFSDRGMLDAKYIDWYRDLLILHKKIIHNEIKDLKGIVIDDWQARTEEFLKVMTNLVKDIIK